MFQRTRLRLTLWYLLIVAIICVLFSLAIYTNVNNEFKRFSDAQPRIQVFQNDDGTVSIVRPRTVPSYRLDPDIIEEARVRFLTELGIINIAILFFSGAAGYFLAGKTLQPIQEMMTEQNRFISDSSHELRTPLTALRSEIEVNLRNKSLSLNQARQLLESNLEEVISLQLLSDRLLELAQHGKSSAMPFEEVDVAETMNTALKKVDSALKKKHMTITKKLQPVSMEGIQDRIQELFVILLDNAIKYSEQKTSITVSVKSDKDKVMIKIADQGYGIEKEDIIHIFDRFYRASQSRSKGNVTGYGLGLSIAKKIVDTHHGSINVLSTPGKGTIFDIEFPTQQNT